MDTGSSSLLVRDPSLWLSLNGAPLTSSSGHVTGAQTGILIIELSVVGMFTEPGEKSLHARLDQAAVMFCVF